MSRSEKIVTLFWLLFGLFIAIKAFTIGIGSFADPGPGFIFFLGGIFMSFLSIIVFAGAYRGKEDKRNIPTSWEGIRWKKIIGLCVSLIIFAYVFEKLGYVVSITLLMLYLFRGIEPQKWHIAVISTIVTVFFVYLVFATWLQCQFPKGIISF